jgi:hypothetical protein
MKPADIGIVLACMINNVDPRELAAVDGFHAGLRKQANSAHFGQQVAAFARDVYAQAGRPGSFEAMLFDQMSKVAHWEPVHFDLLSPVYSALSRLGMEKKAEGEPVLSTAAKWLLGGGIGIGTGLGTLHWALNRDATADDAASKSIEARTALYQQMAKEISAELQANAPEDVKLALRQRNQEQQGV